jgi:hypothetical protein
MAIIWVRMLILQMEGKIMSRFMEWGRTPSGNVPVEVIRLQRLPGREGLFDLFRQVREKIRRDKEAALLRWR